MRHVTALILACLACSGSDDPDLNSSVESNAASYVAVDDPDPRFDYGFTITLTHRNTGQLIVRVPSCTTTVLDPVYSVERVGTGQAAWDPDITCATSGAPYEDLAPGEERTYTLTMRSPWQRLFNGTPVGEFEGTFFFLVRTQICASVNQFGICTPVNKIEYVRSNQFTITTP
jgi:hypothetical protein